MTSSRPDADRRGAATDPAARLEAVHQRLVAAVAELTSGQGWQQMLRTAAALPRYSPHNVLLITSQCPNASAVAGFHTWKAVGRAVRKGEKGIAILAPVTGRPQRDAAAVPDPAASAAVGDSDRSLAGTERDGLPRRPAGFRVVHVFDISQTDGPDLPTQRQPQLLEGQAPPGLLDGLSRQVQEQGFTFIRQHVDVPHPGQDRPNGVTDYLARTVLVRPDLSAAQTSKTLAHELGHVLLHAPASRPADLTRARAEVEAESVAYVVTTAHGLDSSRYTIPYVAGWSAGNLDLVARTAERVLTTAHTILTSTPPPPRHALPPDTRQRLRSLQHDPTTHAERSDQRREPRRRASVVSPSPTAPLPGRRATEQGRPA